MNKILISILSLLIFSSSANAVMFEKYEDWKSKPEERFTEGEKNFQQAMDKILKDYVDKGLSKEDLYRAATAGMLESLNSENQNWNTLLTPRELKEIQSDLTGKVSGVGIHFKFDESTGYGQVLAVIPNSPSAKAGLKKEDQILSVNGQVFKNKQFRDMVASIRGKIGDSVQLKVLRGDQILSLKIKREIIPWTPVEYSKIDSATGLLLIGYFTEETPKLVEEKMKELNANKKLIIDLRNNSGGSFDKSVKTAELFVEKGKSIVSTLDRSGKEEVFPSNKGLLNKDIKVIILTNAETSSGAELFAAALKEQLGSKILGEKTFGKWNAQTIETLSNGFAIKYSVKSFQSPSGKSYQGEGIKPDIQVGLGKGIEPEELKVKYEMPKRLEIDAQLKAALELSKTL